MLTSSQEAKIHLGYGHEDSDKRRHLGPNHLCKPSEKPGLLRSRRKQDSGNMGGTIFHSEGSCINILNVPFFRLPNLCGRIIVGKFNHIPHEMAHGTPCRRLNGYPLTKSDSFL